jgi:nucleoside-diphosphate-sugar epimerase
MGAVGETPRVLIVGGTGFIGSSLIKFLRKETYEIDSLSISLPAENHRVDKVRYLACDLRDESRLEKLLVGNRYNFVVNSGGYVDHSQFGSGGEDVFAAHFLGLTNLVRALDGRTLTRFVQVGSSDEYGGQSAPQVEVMREAPITPYSLAKVASTHFLQMLSRTQNFPAVIIRLFLTYGPEQGDNRFIPQVIKACLQKKTFPVSAGTQYRDFLYIDDAVEAIKSAFHSDKCVGKVINVASGKPVLISDVVELIRECARGGKPEFGKIPFRAGESMSLYADINNAKQLLSWSPTVSLEEGVYKVLAVLKDT